MISSEDLSLIFYIWVLNTTTKFIVKKINLNNIFTIFSPLTKNYGFNIQSNFLVHFTILIPRYKYMLYDKKEKKN